MQQELKLQYNTLLTKGVLKVNYWLDNTIIRNAKEDKNKVFNVSEKYIVKNKNLDSVNITSINDSKNPGTIMVTTNGNRKSNFQTKGD